MQALAETFSGDDLRVLGMEPDLRPTPTFPEEALLEATMDILGRIERTHVAGGWSALDESEEEACCGSCQEGEGECEDVEEAKLDEANPYHDAESGQFAKPTRITKGSGSYQFSAPKNTRWNKPRELDGKWNKTDARRGQKKGSVKWGKRSADPCGRAARAVGKSIRCSDGKQGVPGGLAR